VVGPLINRWLAPLPVLNWFALVRVSVARPLMAAWSSPPSVSIVVPARNEAGNIASLVERLPRMGPADELIFVEGHSTDATWEAIQQTAARFPERRITCIQQSGVGKGDAVRAGFDLARCEILMILDADLTVPPEELPKFYRARVSGVGEFINGSRLVYPMEAQAMRFINMVGNKFFALAFSFVLGQPFKDTLCGTKVIDRESYRQLAANRSYFGEFDPFGDFDLLFGAQRLGLQVVELPIRYRERTYGTTNIQRWRHGWLLIQMTLFAARRVKFI
jgi:glycosyltransferase involved in cell wall biosynthesis